MIVKKDKHGGLSSKNKDYMSHYSVDDYNCFVNETRRTSEKLKKERKYMKMKKIY